LTDLKNKPDKLLVVEDQRIADLARSTEIAWEQIESTDGFYKLSKVSLKGTAWTKELEIKCI